MDDFTPHFGPPTIIAPHVHANSRSNLHPQPHSHPQSQLQLQLQSHDYQPGTPFQYQQQQQQQQQQQPDPGTPTIEAPPAKRRRIESSSDGCVTCRARKVKCPGKPPGLGSCERCASLGHICSFVAQQEGQGKVFRVTPSQNLTEAGTTRKRAQRACKECHSHKTKCSGEKPRCKRCAANDLVCIYQASKRKFSSAPGSQQQTPGAQQSPVGDVESPSPPIVVSHEARQLVSPSASLASPGLTDTNPRPSLENGLVVEDILAQRDLLKKHFKLWFDIWSPCPFMNVLHPEMTNLEIEEKRLNPNIAKIVCVATTRFIHPASKELTSFAEACFKDVENYILQNVGSFLREKGRENLIIFLITISHLLIEQQMGKAWMYMGLGGRLITALQLNWEGAGETPWEQESIRRAVWAFWKLDRYFAQGFDEHLLLRDEVMHLKCPSDDGFIQDGGTLSMPSPTPSGRPDHQLCYYQIELQRLKHSILNFAKNLAKPPTPHPRPPTEASQVLIQVTQLQKCLSDFKRKLPASLLSLDLPAVESWVNSPQCATFFILQSMFWELHIDLYRFSIPGLREEIDASIKQQLPLDWVRLSQKHAIGFAVCLSRFWRCVQEIVSERSYIDGNEKLITVDFSRIFNIIQSTKVLLAARQHHLYSDLQDSPAPFINQEPVTDETLAALIQSNMRLFDQYSMFIPATVELQTRDLRTAVAEFDKGTPYDNPSETIGMPARKPPDNARLPGPHYILEQAIAPPDPGHHRNRSEADTVLRQKKQIPNEAVMSSDSMHSDERPDVPHWLAQARGEENLSSTPALSQPSPVLQQPFIPVHSVVGQSGFGNEASENVWAGPGPIGIYSHPVTAVPGASHPHEYTPLVYDRARGHEMRVMALEGRPAGPPAHPGLPLHSAHPIHPSQPTHPDLLTASPSDHPGFYQRAGGKRLPFPSIEKLQ